MRQAKVRKSDSQTLTEALVNLEERLVKIEDMMTAIYNGFQSPTAEDSEDLMRTQDPFALLNVFKEWGAVGSDREKPGMHEETDREMVLDIFEETGVNFDPRDPWCGAGLRAALILTGYEDPGEICHKASNYEHYGEPCERQPGAIWVGYAHVGVVSEKDGHIWGCNQSNRVCEQHERFYGEPICFRLPT